MTAAGSIKIPIFTEFNGQKYHIGDYEVPLKLTLDDDPKLGEPIRSDGALTYTVETDLDPEEIAKKIRAEVGVAAEPEFKLGDKVKIVGPSHYSRHWTEIDPTGFEGVIGRAYPGIPVGCELVEFLAPREPIMRRWYFPRTSLKKIEPLEIVPDYGQDSRLVDIVARLLYQSAQQYNERFSRLSWKHQDEYMRAEWRRVACAKLKEETGHGGE
jgi:hypothetical protein